MSNKRDLHSWFSYLDKNRSPYHPTVSTNILTDGFFSYEENDNHSKDWVSEEWLVRSVLVPVEQLEDAAKTLTPHDIVFDTGWDFENNFSFGEFTNNRGFDLHPWLLTRKHPITNELIIELRRDFVIYHCLEEKQSKCYYHPLDQILVTEFKIETHKYYDPAPKSWTYCDYLQDFLSVVGMGLVICTVADRFANAEIEEELQLGQSQKEKIDELTSISKILHPAEFTAHGYYQGRSTLWRNFLVYPYQLPKVERTPWYYSGEITVQEGDLPRFIINSEGAKSNLREFDQPVYLYFRPEVLQKYIQNPEYKAFFHMKNWGFASTPTSESIDIGINSQGLVNAFAPDVANLSLSEQAYWASFSSLPSGEVCEEMFQTRMQQNPPHSPGTVELISNTRSRLNSIFQAKFSVELLQTHQPSEQELKKLSVGPVSGQFSEVLDLTKILYGWVAETLKTDSLRAALVNLGGTVDSSLRQIKLLEKILIAKGLDQAQARAVTAPLVGLNDLRINAAHIGGPNIEKTFQLMGASPASQTPRVVWNLCVDAVVGCLDSVANTLSA
ncbi:hypothetical protein NDA01_25885 [Trichocoleus desertorum AS-A10]